MDEIKNEPLEQAAAMAIRHKGYDYRDFRIDFRYTKTADQHEHRPTMFVWARGRRSSWAIQLEAAYKYVDANTGAPSRWLLDNIPRILDYTGMSNDHTTAFRVCSAIVDAIPDLLEMPPWEKYRRQLKAKVEELTLKVGGDEMRVQAPVH